MTKMARIANPIKTPSSTDIPQVECGPKVECNALILQQSCAPIKPLRHAAPLFEYLFCEVNVAFGLLSARLDRPVEPLSLRFCC